MHHQVAGGDDLFKADSMSSHALYVQGLGAYARCKTGAVQTNHDAQDVDVQTDQVGESGCVRFRLLMLRKRLLTWLTRR
jgi:hypothetical protein